jgi:hypothetical protein
VQIVVAGRLADPVFGSQLLHPRAVEEPTQHQHRLIAGRQSPSVGAGTPPRPLGHQQPGQEIHRLLAYRQHRRVCQPPDYESRSLLDQRLVVVDVQVATTVPMYVVPPARDPAGVVVLTSAAEGFRRAAPG